MLPKNKQNKLGQIKKDRIKDENHLNYTTFSFIKHALFIFHDINLAKKKKKILLLFSSSNLLLVSLLQSLAQ